jgi:hypothetical protein
LLKRQVTHSVSDSLQVRECAKEVRNPGRSPVAAIKLGDFWFGLLLKPKGRELSSRWTVLVTVKVYTPRVGQTCGECESVGSGHKWILGEDPSPVTVCLPVFRA